MAGRRGARAVLTHVGPHAASSYPNPRTHPPATPQDYMAGHSKGFFSNVRYIFDLRDVVDDVGAVRQGASRGRGGEGREGRGGQGRSQEEPKGAGCGVAEVNGEGAGKPYGRRACPVAVYCRLIQHVRWTVLPLGCDRHPADLPSGFPHLATPPRVLPYALRARPSKLPLSPLCTLTVMDGCPATTHVCAQVVEDHVSSATSAVVKAPQRAVKKAAQGIAKNTKKLFSAASGGNGRWARRGRVRGRRCGSMCRHMACRHAACSLLLARHRASAVSFFVAPQVGAGADGRGGRGGG